VTHEQHKLGTREKVPKNLKRFYYVE